MAERGDPPFGSHVTLGVYLRVAGGHPGRGEILASEGGDSTDEHTTWLAETILSAAEGAGIGVTVITADPSLRVSHATRAAEELLGRTAAELVGMDPATLLIGDDQTRLAPVIREFVATGAYPSTVDASLTRPDGTAVALEIGLGEMTVAGKRSLVTFMADVTQLRAALDALKRLEDRFRLVVERIPEAIFITEGTAISYANPAFVALLGVDPGGKDGQVDVTDLLEREDVPRLYQLIERLEDGTTAHGEYRMRAGNRRLTLEVSALGAELDGKRTVVWLGQDVTQRKHIEDQLLQADRLAVLGTLAAGMAHAINNPLSYTLLNLEHVARRLRDLGTERDYYSEARVRLAEAHDGADRVAKVVRQMRSLSRSRSATPASVRVRAVLESVLAMVGNEVRHRGQLSVRMNDSPAVFAREGELEQAFLGLLLYVTRALPEDAGAGREIRMLLGTDASGNAVITVSDDGPALSPEVQSRLFDPFGSAETMGLGLAMCHAIVTSLGGHIDLESGATRGTTLRVVLPPAATAEGTERTRPSTLRPHLTVPATAARARVLVIDDDPGVASTLRAMLEAHHEVKSVESARVGLKLLLSEEDFDIVFCDLVMPEVSGIDLYCALELNRPERLERIVFMTGGVFSREAELLLARVPNARIEKPFSLARVEQLLAQAVGQRPARPGARQPGGTPASPPSK